MHTMKSDALPLHFKQVINERLYQHAFNNTLLMINTIINTFCDGGWNALTKGQ